MDEKNSGVNFRKFPVKNRTTPSGISGKEEKLSWYTEFPFHVTFFPENFYIFTGNFYISRRLSDGLIRNVRLEIDLSPYWKY